jgi:2,4-dienoyl-CoA reductase-like NADH-dependent reductase (Old Yellow Enzyme family)
MMDGIPGGLTLAEGVQVVSELAGMGINGVELSGGIGGKLLVNVKKGIRSSGEEAYFIHFARQARPVTELPLLLVGGFRSRSVMEAALASGDVDFISMCRPLINNPDFPRLLRLGELEVSGCISSNNCWAEENGVGIGCKCPLEKLA